MKTIEQKAKAYDEVVGKLKGFMMQGVDPLITRADVQDFFPELAESDDERIRKELIEFVEIVADSQSNKKEWLSWLEKQKEYESTDFDYVWETTDCSQLTSALDKYSEDAIKKVCHAWYDKGIELERKNWLEKQGEKDNWAEELNAKIKERNKQCLEIIQKCVSPCDGCNNYKGCVTCVDGDNWAHYHYEDEQKPYWSDEQIKAIESLKHKWSMGDSTEAKYKVEAYDELIELLK